MSYARLILSASSKEELPAGMTKPLPPRYAVTPLIQHYIDTIHVLLPFFEETTFYRSVDAVFNTNQQKATSWDHWTLRMVLAISSISFSEQRGDVHYTDALGHVNAALEHSEHVLRPGSVASIQALLLLTQYAMLDPHHFDSWTLIGAASRTMVDLGMHQDPSKSAAMPKATLELRRRVFHCLYAMDRYVAFHIRIALSLTLTGKPRLFKRAHFHSRTIRPTSPFHSKMDHPQSSIQKTIIGYHLPLSLP